VVDLALYPNGPITELNAMAHTFAAARNVDDAAVILVRFANGSIGSFEASRYGVGYANRNTIEMNGSKGMLRVNFEEMNHLAFYDATDAPNLRGARNLMITGHHPYWQNFWKPGHPIGAHFYRRAGRFPQHTRSRFARTESDFTPTSTMV
jgi:predicted dehydrogenase